MVLKDRTLVAELAGYAPFHRPPYHSPCYPRPRLFQTPSTLKPPPPRGCVVVAVGRRHSKRWDALKEMGCRHISQGWTISLMASGGAGRSHEIYKVGELELVALSAKDAGWSFRETTEAKYKKLFGLFEKVRQRHRRPLLHRSMPQCPFLPRRPLAAPAVGLP